MTSVKPRPSAALTPAGPSEFEILKQNHKFLRDDEDNIGGQPGSWDEALARKFYSNLWREYALCDLKHYKSGNFCLRWRSEDEVVSGSGQHTCGNTRCKYHDIMDQIGRPAVSSSTHKRSKVALHTLELPFGYSEGGEAKSALVKVVLCDKCVKKIMWKREQAKKERASGSVESLEQKAEGSLHESSKRSLSLTGDSKQGKSDERGPQRRRRSRSLSPSRGPDKRHKRR